MRQFGLVALFVLSTVVAGCSGGGGGGTPPVSTTPGPGTSASPHSSTSPSPTPTTSPTSGAVSGTLTNYTTNAPIAGAIVTIGSTPALSCSGGWTGCGTPAAPLKTTTTSASGTFSITNVPNGTYFLTIVSSADASLNPATGTQQYTILHRFVTVSGATALGTVNISALSSDESAWVAQLNSDRANVAIPATGPVVADEYAEEQARLWAANIVNGTTVYGDAGYGPYQSAYSADPGAIGSVAGALNLDDTWQDAMTSWFAEESNCAGGNWETCVWADNTGHYINLSQDSLVWVGVGESSSPIPAGQTYAGLYAFDVMTIYNGQTARTLPDARTRRVAVSSVR